MKSIFVCSECGYESTKWLGKCPGCEEWNTMEETLRKNEKASSGKKIRADVSEIKPADSGTVIAIKDLSCNEELRYDTGEEEFNRVLGGGIVKGSLVLVGGDPGIGKSTLLLQICQNIGKTRKILYVSGEESAKQIKMRAKRLSVTSDNLYILSETDIESVCSDIASHTPELVIIDSIQTMYHSSVSSSCGSVAQVRECTNFLMHTAKSLNIPIMIVGHVNKDGGLAGPKVLEHMVDTVLNFEGDRHDTYRILRAVKNRFGATNEIGVFEMREEGLRAVENPSKMMLSSRPENVAGTCITCMMEGTRPILAEVQALTCKSNFPSPRRMSTGLDYNRMSMLLAVLEKRAGIYTANQDVYINAVNGLRLSEPSSDLAVILALASAIKDAPVAEGTIAIGEIGLAGEIRSVHNIETRIAEIKRLGFRKIVIPNQDYSDKFGDLEILKARNIKQAIAALI